MKEICPICRPPRTIARHLSENGYCNQCGKFYKDGKEIDVLKEREAKPKGDKI